MAEEDQQDPWADFSPREVPAPIEARGDPWADFSPRGKPAQPAEQPEGVLATGIREAAHGVIPTIGTVAGGALGSVLGPVGTIGGAIGGGWLAGQLQERGLHLLGIDDAQQRAVNLATNPKSALAGEVTAMLPSFGVGAAPAIARGAGAVIMGGLEAGQAYLEGREQDPLRIGAMAAAGATLTKPTALTRGIEAQIGRAIGRPVTARPGEPAPAVEPAAEARPTPEPTQPSTAAQEAVQATPHGTAGPIAHSNVAEAPPPTADVVATGEPQNQPVRVREGHPGGPEEAAKPREMTSEEIETARTGMSVGQDPAQIAALRTATGEPAAPLPPGFDLTRPGIQAMARRRGMVVEGGEPRPLTQEEVEAHTRAIQAAAEQRMAAREPPLSPAAQAFRERMAAQRAASERARGAPVPALEETAAQVAAQPAEGGLPRTPTGGTPPPPPGEPPVPPRPPREPPEAPAADLVAATESDKQQGILSSLRRTFMPMLSESAKTAGAALREAYGPIARLKEQAGARFTNDLHQLGNRMDQPTFEKFVDAYESGQVHTLPPDQQRLAKVLEQNNKDWWNEIKKLPGTEQMEETKNYLTHMYDNKNGEVDKFVNDWFGAAGGSLRARKYPTFADARAAGLKALSNNPIEHFARYSEGLGHYIGQRRMLADLENQGRIGYFGPKVVGASGTPQPFVRGGPPEGYAELKMPWAKNAQGQRAYAPRDVAETLNQFYDAGLRRTEAGNNFMDFAQRTKNMWTAVELGLSAYHATTMAVESLASNMARTMQLASTGNFARAAKNMMQFEPVSAYRLGRQLRQVYRGTAEGTAGRTGTANIVDILTRANIQPGNLHITGEYDMSRLGNLWDAYKRGALPQQYQAALKEITDSYGLKLPKVLLENVQRVMQTISKPLFEHYIPELKLGTMAKDLEAWLHTNPTATAEETTAYARRISDSIDNRMGEMNMNNLFMNKTAKQAAMLGLRSFGFTVGGPFREIGAGLGVIARDLPRGRNPLRDPRAAYALAFAPTIFAISAAYQYMRTGKGPEDWRDLVTPQTGGTIKSVGQQVPERILMPGYHKDFLGYFVNPSGSLHEVQAKMAAPWTALTEQLTGEDWRDKPYVPPRASTLEWLAAHGQALGARMLPIGPKQLAEGRKEGSALTIPEQMIGARTPGAYMLNPKGLEKYLTQQRQKDWTASEKQENRRRQERGLPPLPKRQLPPSGYARGGPVLQRIGARRYEEGGTVRSRRPDPYGLRRDTVTETDSWDPTAAGALPSKPRERLGEIDPKMQGGPKIHFQSKMLHKPEDIFGDPYAEPGETVYQQGGEVRSRNYAAGGVVNPPGMTILQEAPHMGLKEETRRPSEKEIEEYYQLTNPPITQYPPQEQPRKPDQNWDFVLGGRHATS